MDIFYLDEQERKRYEAAWEYESDRLSMISESEQKGLERGKSLGSRQAKLETAKTMLTMHYPFEIFVRFQDFLRRKYGRLVICNAVIGIRQGNCEKVATF
mgnify:CR=1 FL=1